MAKRGEAKSESAERGESKADLIRQAASALGDGLRPRDIVASLKEKGITVGYTQIAKALKSGKFQKRGRRKGAAAEATANDAGESEKVNKAQRIRDVAKTAKTMGKKVRPKDIITELAKEGVEVSSAQVSSTLAAAGYRRSRRRRTVAAVGAASSAKSAVHGLDINALIATKALIEKIGGIENAEEALRALKRLG